MYSHKGTAWTSSYSLGPCFKRIGTQLGQHISSVTVSENPIVSWMLTLEKKASSKKEAAVLPVIRSISLKYIQFK